VCYSLKGNAIDRNTAQNGRPWSDGASYTLDATDRHGVCYAPNGNHCGNYEEAAVSATLQTRYHYGSGGDAAAVVYDCRGNGDGLHTPTLTGDHQRRVSDYTALCVGNGQLHQMSMAEQSNTLDCMHDQQAVLMQGEHPRKYIVRRLTPLECCRLQGFPDWWEDGVEGSDSARYKMWGNGIALPCAVDVLRRIAKELQKDTPGAVKPC
jgi:site-specific DNA-cytosine methylase